MALSQVVEIHDEAVRRQRQILVDKKQFFHAGISAFKYGAVQLRRFLGDIRFIHSAQHMYRHLRGVYCNKHYGYAGNLHS